MPFIQGKRGQITLFIIIGVLTLAIASGLFFLRSLQEEPLEAQYEAQIADVTFSFAGVQSYVEHCLAKTAQEAIKENSRQGGYFLLPEHSTTELLENIPYYYELGQEHFPTEEEFAVQVARYVDTMLFLCLDDFRPFTKYGTAIEAEEPVTTAILSPRRLLLQTHMPTTISQDVRIQSIEVYTASLDARQLHENIALAKEVVLSANGGFPGVLPAEGSSAESSLAGDGSICLTCFSNLALENDIFVGILPYYDNTYIFELEDGNYELNGEKYLLRFAVRHEGGGRQ